MTTIDTDEVERYFNYKTVKNNIMYNLFYSNISDFSGNVQGMLVEQTYKTTIQNMHKLGWKAQFFKSSDV